VSSVRPRLERIIVAHLSLKSVGEMIVNRRLLLAAALVIAGLNSF
jgi:hypothetical protein